MDIVTNVDTLRVGDGLASAFVMYGFDGPVSLTAREILIGGAETELGRVLVAADAALSATETLVIATNEDAFDYSADDEFSSQSQLVIAGADARVSAPVVDVRGSLLAVNYGGDIVGDVSLTESSAFYAGDSGVDGNVAITDGFLEIYKEFDSEPGTGLRVTGDVSLTPDANGEAGLTVDSSARLDVDGTVSATSELFEEDGF
jgi:hypothetical protein